MKKRNFNFTPKYKELQQILMDNDLAAIGDAYTNFIYSLYLSILKGKPTGAKVSGYILSMALKESGIRKYLPSRMDRHKLADAAEALLVYVWLKDLLTIRESVDILLRNKKSVEAFTLLIIDAKKKIKSSKF